MTKRTSKPRLSIETITPETASAWLDFNQHNRKPKSTRIPRYARDMKNGKWKLTGETVVFDEDGWLIDGQNRLMACVQADAPFETIVVRGIERDAQIAMDSGAPRRPADALAMKGHAKAKDLAAAVVVHRAWGAGKLKSVVSHIPADRPTHTEVVEYVAQNPGLVEDVAFTSSHRSQLRGVPIGATAVAFGEFRQIDPEEALDFFRRIKDGVSTGIGDPILTFTRRLADETGRGHRMSPATALYMYMRAWNAIRDGERLTKFQFGAEGRWSEIPQPR